MHTITTTINIVVHDVEMSIIYRIKTNIQLQLINLNN